MEKQQKLYTTWQVAWATFLGGPLAGTYLISANFKTLEKHSQAKKTLYSGVLGTAFFFFIALLLPKAVTDKVPSLAGLMTILFLALAMGLQGQAITAHLQQGGKKYSVWRATGIGLLSLGLTLLFVIIVALVLYRVGVVKYE